MGFIWRIVDDYGCGKKRVQTWKTFFFLSNLLDYNYRMEEVFRAWRWHWLIMKILFNVAGVFDMWRKLNHSQIDLFLMLNQLFHLLCTWYYVLIQIRAQNLESAPETIPEKRNWSIEIPMMVWVLDWELRLDQLVSVGNYSQLYIIERLQSLASPTN